MRLTSKGRYAIQAILDLAFRSYGKPVRLKEISVRQKISRHYLEQIFRKLRKGHIVKSIRGPGGGYVLFQSMNNIPIKDVLVNAGENINPAIDLVENKEIKETTLEFTLSKSYFENLGNMMQTYLSTSIGELLQQARGTQEIPQNISHQVELNRSDTSKTPSHAPKDQTLS